MALILSAATGNFNAGATWVGGVVPTVGDEARASTGHTVTITANVTCTELSNAGTGIFTLNNGVTLTANVTHKSATANVTCLQFTAASPATATIVGNITGASAAAATTVFGAVRNVSTGTLNVTGSVTGGSAGSAVGITNVSTGTLNVTGNITGGSTTSCQGLYSQGNGTVTVVGNLIGGSGNNAGALSNDSNVSVTITGSVNGGSNATSAGVTNSGTGVVTITGSITASTAVGVTNVSTGSVTITGNITASTAAGVTNSSTATLTISGGTYTASTAANAVISTNASSIVRASGSFIYASNGFVPINTPKFILLSTPTLAKTRYALNGSTTYVDMFTADNGLNQAAITDVRFGTVYASGELTGVAYIPTASSVAFGVPVDNTTGTATLTAANLRAALGMASANLDTQLAVLSNLDAAVSSRLAPSGTLATVTTLTNAPASVTPSDIWSHAARTITGGLVDTATTLTNAPTVPSVVQIRQEMDTNSTQLTSIKAKTDLLETTRLAQCSTVATTGDQIAAAFNSP